jgi:3-phosphoshikimate 1-carboxyvinyltransferase
VDITLGVLRDYGVNVTETDRGYFIGGGQKFKPFSGEVEGDYSQAAFFEVANALGSNVEILGLNEKSSQGDKKIVEICEKMVYNSSGELSPFEIDCSDIPDLVPILTVLATFCKGRSRIYNVARLRIKECDRLAAITQCLNAVGGKVTEFEDSLEIEGVDSLEGGEVDGYNDHRIPMAMSVAATRCRKPLTILGAECVRKSYPDFWNDYEALAGKISIEK